MNHLIEYRINSKKLIKKYTYINNLMKNLNLYLENYVRELEANRQALIAEAKAKAGDADDWSNIDWDNMSAQQLKSLVKKLASKIESADDIDSASNKVSMGGQIVNKKSVKAGESAEKNGTNGLYAVDETKPEDEAEWEQLFNTETTTNKDELIARFAGEQDFFVQGEAGWAKTQLITKTAKQAGYHVITVYLDKAEASDLGGIPLPRKNDSGRIYMDHAIPAWAAEMIDHPHKYLLFFDEMNQAQPDVLNALMPIVLEHTVCGVKFDDMIVGAAGNFSKENDALSKMSTPLEDRFKPIIIWEVHTEETWKEWYAWARKEYEETIGKEVINKTEELYQYWNSPRDVTRVIFTWMYEQKKKHNTKANAKIVRKWLDNCIWREIDPSELKKESTQNKLNKFAEWLSEWIKSGVNTDDAKAIENGSEESANSRKKRTSKTKDADQISQGDREDIEKALRNGYYLFQDEVDDGKGNKQKKTYKIVCTEENVIRDIFDPNVTGVTAEVLKKIIRQMESDGKAPKFKTNDEAFKSFDERGVKVYDARAWDPSFDKDKTIRRP